MGMFGGGFDEDSVIAASGIIRRGAYYNQDNPAILINEGKFDKDFWARREAFADAFSRYYSGDTSFKPEQPKLWAYMRALDTRESIIPTRLKVDIKPIDIKSAVVK